MLVLSGMAWAEEAGMEAGQVYAFPELEPEFDISLGYRINDYSDSRRAEEFEYLDEDSVTVGADIRIFSMPNRLHLDLDIKNKYDFFGDLSYAYKDIILFRGIHRNVYHNLSNINLDPLLIPANPVDRRDIGEDYDVRVGISDVWLRLKAPDYPLHFFGNVRYIRKEGDKKDIYEIARKLLNAGLLDLDEP